MTEQSSKPRRWSAKRKREMVLRLFQGAPIDELSREIGVEIYRLEQWRSQALNGLEALFKDRSSDPLEEELKRAKQRIGDLSMENELLIERIQKKGPFPTRRSK